MDRSSGAERGGSAMGAFQNNPRKSLYYDIMRSPPWLPIQMWPRLWQLRLASLQMCFLKDVGRHENLLRGNPNLTGGPAEPGPLRHLLFLGSSSRIWFVFPSFPSISLLQMYFGKDHIIHTGSAAATLQHGFTPPNSDDAALWTHTLPEFYSLSCSQTRHVRHSAG